MTPDAQRIAVAKACGINFCPCGRPFCAGEGNVPDYLNDLNAMHEAEKSLFPVHVHELNGPDRFKQYREQLECICLGHPGGAFRATAVQRAEALLKTVGKWDEDESI